MSRTSTQRRTVVGYVRAAVYQLERAVIAGFKCRSMLDEEVLQIRQVRARAQELAETLAPRKRRRAR